MEKEIDIGSKKVVIKEIKYIDLIDINPEDKRGTAIKLFKHATNLTDEEINNISAKEGTKLMQEINNLNGFGQDFQKP